jgi:hypothetical protein
MRESDEPDRPTAAVSMSFFAVTPGKHGRQGAVPLRAGKHRLMTGVHRARQVGVATRFD